MDASVIGDLLRGILPDGFDASLARPQCLGGCGASVDRRGRVCAPCSARETASRRRARLAEAVATLPPWPWCRFGDPVFAERTAGRATRRHGTEVADVVAADAARAWRRAHGGLVLCGPTGTGKTSLMVAIGYQLVEAAMAESAAPALVDFAAGIRFADASDIARARRGWPLGKGDPPELTEAMEATLLLLDEMGREPLGDPTLFELFNYRYRKGLPTVTTSRLTRDDMKRPDRYGTDGARRLLDTGVVLELKGNR